MRDHRVHRVPDDSDAPVETGSRSPVDQTQTLLTSPCAGRHQDDLISRRDQGVKDRQLHFLVDYIHTSVSVQQSLCTVRFASILQAADMVADTLGGTGTLLLCGNGGAAASCQHMAVELVGRLNRNVDRRPLSALALTTDSAFLTGHGNDAGFDRVFERQVRALGRPGDVLLAISTSGTSANVLRAVEEARAMSLSTIGVSGEGGVLKDMVECAIVVPTVNTGHVQEAFLVVQHVICNLVEHTLFGSAVEF